MTAERSPKTRIARVVDEFYGTSVEDPYRWLEDGADPEVQAWIAAQNAHTRAVLDVHPARPWIHQRLSQLMQLGMVGVPIPRRGRYFFEARKGTDELPILYVQTGLHGQPSALLDPSSLTPGRTTVLQHWSPSPDGTLLAHALSEAANDQAAIHVLNVKTRERLDDLIPAELYPSPQTPVEWAHDGRGFWYSRRAPGALAGEEKFHQKLYYHQLGRDFRDDSLVFGEAFKKEDFPWARLSHDGRYLLVNVAIRAEQVRRTEVYIQDLQNPGRGFIPIVQGIEAEGFASFHRDRVFLHTNHDAPNWKLMAVRTQDACRGDAQWETVVPEGSVPLEGYVAVGDSLFVATLENICSVVRRHRLDGRVLAEIPLSAAGAVTALHGEEDGTEVFLDFSSFLVPTTVYRFDLRADELEVFRSVDAGIEPERFEVRQVWFASRDGTRVPMFLIHKKGLSLDGGNPTVLYGYGGFNISLTPVFLNTILPFIESGGVFARVNLRGGGEFGEKWHEAGMRERKQNVFDDFLAAAEWLFAQRYTQPSKLAIFGRSNGGLLVGAAMTQRPELFQAAIIGAPVLDMLRYHLFHGGRLWIPDYGSVEEPELFPYLLKYSPYHNVRAGEAYPATFIYTADRDDRVHPMHAYKMAARLQAANGSSRPILLRVEGQAGHQGGAAASKVVALFTDVWSFVFEQLGMHPPAEWRPIAHSSRPLDERRR